MDRNGTGEITRKLIISFCLLISIFSIYGVYSLYEIYTISNLARTIYDHPLVVSNAALQANVSITKMHRNMKDVVLFESDELIQKSIAAVDQQEKLVYQHLDIVRERILGEEGEKLAEEAKSLFDNWRPIRSEVITLVREGNRDEAAEITIGKGADHVVKLEEKMMALTNYARNKASSFMEASHTTFSRLSVLSIIFLLLSVGISSLIAFFTLKKTKSTERELRESRQLLMNAVDYAPIGMTMVAPGGKFHKVNEAFCRMTGYSEQELLSMDFQQLTHPDDLDIGSRVVEQLINREIDKTAFEKKYIGKNGNTIDVYLTTTLLRDDQGIPQYFFTQALDITERNRAEQRAEHLNRVLKAIRDVNQLIVRERDPLILIGEGCRLMVDNRGYSSALLLLTDETNKLIAWDGAGFSSSSDTLKEQLSRHELPSCCALAGSSGEPVVIADRTGICDRCPIGKKCGNTSSLCARLVHGNNSFGFLVVAQDTNAEVDDEELSLFNEMAGDLAYALNFIQLGTDHALSESKRESLEDQLTQAQKMESIGRLAGGVAHDYNNMLSIIIGYAESAIEQLDPGDPIYDDIREILDAGNRSSEITRQLLAFARQQTVAPKVLDLNENSENMLKMLRRLIGEDIDLAWLPGAELWPVKIDPSQIDQILANLCVNAKDAIAGVGKVTIETGNRKFDEEYCVDHPGFIPGDFVSLAVSDTGRGIPAEIVDSIFEPFFTTKKLHQGTGLGLATVYGIVKQNDGFINVYSEPEEGSTIKIYLPRYTGQIKTKDRKKTEEVPQSRGETILLVEDDESILRLGRKMLESLGYKIFTAGTPGEAIELAKKHADEINLLLTDVVMPEMNGRELSEHLQTQNPGLKVLFMSGYTANVIAHRGVLDEGVHFIAKPLSKKELAVKVRETLGNFSEG